MKYFGEGKGSVVNISFGQNVACGTQAVITPHFCVVSFFFIFLI